MKFQCEYKLTEDEFLTFCSAIGSDIAGGDSFAAGFKQGFKSSFGSKSTSAPNGKGLSRFEVSFIFGAVAVSLLFAFVDYRSVNWIWVLSIAAALSVGFVSGVFFFAREQDDSTFEYIKREMRELPGSLDYKLTLDDTTLTSDSGAGVLAVRLANISSIVESKAGVLVRVGLNGVFFPDRCFRDAAEKNEVVDYLRSKIV